jgi:hypothetical protein
MKLLLITLAAAGLFAVVGVTADIPASQATTTFIGSTIERIDAAQHTVTFRTREGQSWTMPLADPNLLKEEPLAKGDIVSIESDPSDKITKIVKLAGLPSEPAPSPKQAPAGDN